MERNPHFQVEKSLRTERKCSYSDQLKGEGEMPRNAENAFEAEV